MNEGNGTLAFERSDFFRRSALCSINDAIAICVEQCPQVFKPGDTRDIASIAGLQHILYTNLLSHANFLSLEEVVTRLS